MRFTRLYAEALAAYDISREALQTFWNDIKPNGNGSKLSTDQIRALTELSRAVEQWQERIRIHRRVPLPGTMAPRKPKPARPKWSSSNQASSISSTPKPPGSPKPTPPSLVEQSETPSPSGSEGDEGADPLSSEP